MTVDKHYWRLVQAYDHTRTMPHLLGELMRRQFLSHRSN